MFGIVLPLRNLSSICWVPKATALKPMLFQRKIKQIKLIIFILYWIICDFILDGV